ncbi:hypothetical protein CAEBREN_19573 [Caenorhabditis brenneri]|uniref:Uncharacterized protein n=1 Tax=Caenorhabditis brenneri TaxID=135651 RepID=G0N6G4_CAEBE|nr:hypothetical protein CAEBREN_19573 [Caenorhabditis brenneri]
MGQCLSGAVGDTDAAGPGYSYQPPVNESGIPPELEMLERSPAGIKDCDATSDNYAVVHYKDAVKDIFNHTNNLRIAFDTIIDDYCKNKPTTNDLMKFDATGNDLISEFYKFFRFSVFKVDEFVQIRKDIAVNALHEARRFKAEVDQQIKLPHPNFNECRNLGLHLYVLVDELYDHFFKTFAFPPPDRRASLISFAQKANKARGGGT